MSKPTPPDVSVTPFLPWDDAPSSERKTESASRTDLVAGYEFDSAIVVPTHPSTPSMDVTFVPGITSTTSPASKTTPLPSREEVTFVGNVGSTPSTPLIGSTMPQARHDNATIAGGSATSNIDPAKTLADGKPAIPGFEVLDELGRGGMGVVYKARQIHLNRMVALKMILNGGGSEEAIARFKLEAEAIARVRHPGIVQVYDIAEYNGMPYFTLEFCDGGSLARELREGAFAPKRCAEVVEQLARAMQVAHEARVIHRDLKPANILKTSDGEYKITDFGLAKKLDVAEDLTQTGAVMGTPSYMSPEQASGQVEILGAPCDIYSLGVILYECITGRTPFRGANVMDLIIQVVSEDPMPPSKLEPKTPRDLETICLKCLHKNIDRRYASAGELADDLARFIRGEPILGRPVPLREKAWKWIIRHPATTATVAMSLLAFAAFIAFIIWSNAELKIAVDEAVQNEKIARDELQEQQEIFQDRTDAVGAMTEARAAAEHQNWEQCSAAAQRAYERARKHLTLDDFVKLHVEAEQLLDRAEERLRIQKSLARFQAARDLVRTYGTPFSGLDLQSKIELSKKEIQKALGLFGVDLESNRKLVLNGGFTERERVEIAEGCFELILILSDVESQPLPEESREKHIERAERGLAILKAAQELTPRMPSLGLRPWRLLKQAGEEEAALKVLTETNEKRPETAFDYFLIGEDHFRLGDVKTAQAALYEALQRQPNHFWTQFYLALCALQSNSPAEARTYLNSCLSQKPAFVGLHTLRGLAHTALKSYDHAADDYQKALDLNPEPSIRYGILVNRALMRFDLDDTEHAAQDLESAIALKPDQYQAYVNLARVLEKTSIEKATQALESAIERQPKMGALYRLRAQFRVKQKQIDEAIADYDLAIDKEPPHSPAVHADRLEKAKLLYRQKRFEEAITACNEGVKKSALVRFYTLRGEAFIELRRYPEAVESYDRAEQLGWEPDAEGCRFRGLARGKVGRHSEAIADLSLSIEKRPLPEVFGERGWLYLVSSAPKLALWDFEESLRRKETADAYNGRGFARVVLGDVTGAIADANEALRQGPETPRLLFNCARIYSQSAAKMGTSEKGRSPNSAIQQARHQLLDQTVELLRRAIDRLPEEKRADFWRDIVRPDESLNPLRDWPAFVKLDERFRGPARSPK